MAQHRKYNIRSPEQLPPDREHRASTRRRAAAQVFGLYLPLLTDIEVPLSQAIKDTSQTLARIRKGPSSALNPNDYFGMTFAQRTQVNRNMRNMLGQGFVLRHFVDHLQNSPVAVGAEYIDVPVAGFTWKGKGNRKLAAELDFDSLAFRSLCTQAAEIADIVSNERGTNNLEVAIPDHVTVATYGNWGDGMSLNRKHRGIIAEQFDEIFLSHNDDVPLTMRLGSLVVGGHYCQPFEGMDLIPSLPPFSEPTLDEELLELDFEPALVY